MVRCIERKTKIIQTRRITTILLYTKQKRAKFVGITYKNEATKQNLWEQYFKLCSSTCKSTKLQENIFASYHVSNKKYKLALQNQLNDYNKINSRQSSRNLLKIVITIVITNLAGRQKPLIEQLGYITRLFNFVKNFTNFRLVINILNNVTSVWFDGRTIVPNV